MHRIQRVPDGTSRRHTSTVTVAVLDSATVDDVWVDPADVDEQVYRGSGPGGQHRNRSETCVRLVHQPTGIVVHATESRSQWENRRAAHTELARRVAAREAAVRRAELDGARVDQIGDGGRGGFDWNWCAWRDEVSGPGGRRFSYSQGLKGRLQV